MNCLRDLQNLWGITYWASTHSQVVIQRQRLVDMASGLAGKHLKIIRISCRGLVVMENSHQLNKLYVTCKKGKGKFLYSAVSSPQDRSKRFTLYFPDIPVHSDTISASLGSIQPYATINARRLLVHISTTVYSQVLIYSAEWTGAM